MAVKLSSILISLLVLALTTLVLKVLNWVWFRPKKLEKILRDQGLNGNPYRILIGDMKDLMSATNAEKSRPIQLSDDISQHMFPYYHQARSKYGPNSFVWFGPSPKLMIADPVLLKEIFTKPDVFHKPVPDPIGQSIAGGLTFLEDEKWAKHRRIINPAFHMEKLKDKTATIRMSCSIMIEKWDALVSRRGNSGELDVWPYIRELSGDMISRAAFGSSHKDGSRIFELQNEQVKLVLQLLAFHFIPGWSYLPTKANRKMKALAKEIKSLLRGIIDQREKAMKRGEDMASDLLGILMESNFKEMQQQGNKKMGMSIEDVVEECKLFYIAGSDTTSNLLVWTMVMLSKHPEWQARAREEVLQVFGKSEPTFDGVNRLKIVTMILQEVLRLYPPVPLVLRSPTKELRLGDITLPKDVDVILLMGMLHHDPEVWGDDVQDFKPERFSGGISSAAKTQFAFMPFGFGPRICIGQNFAMLEAKISLAMILQRFSFELSSSYLHAPFPILTLEPQHGASMVLHKL